MGTLGNQVPVHTKESQMFGVWFRGGEGTICVLFVHYFPVLTSDLAAISAKERLWSTVKGCGRTMMDFDLGWHQYEKLCYVA